MPEQFKADCLLCGHRLTYLAEPESLVCALCGQSFESQVACEQRHYVCDRCHSASANDLIERVCIQSESTDPVGLAISLMKSPSVKMHGPEHHFLVPAVLLSAHYNRHGNAEEKAKKIRVARQRAEHVLGGFCGFYGACGAAVGTGIFVSLITDSTPLSTGSWGLANRMTAESLRRIGAIGGPRCCKRDSFIALKTAGEFLKSELKTDLAVPDKIACAFSELNRECLLKDCPFHNPIVTAPARG
jgi:hypothetical protein